MNENVKTLCFRRVFKACLWNFVLSFSLIAVFLFFVNLNLLNPISWIKDWLGCLLGWKILPYLALLMAIVIVQGIITSKEYINAQPFYSTRFSMVMKLFNLNNLMGMSVNVIVGYLIPWMYLSLTKGSLNSFSSDNVLNEERLFLIMACVWVNLCYYISQNFSGKHLAFPVIQLPVWHRIQSGLLPTIKSSIPFVFMPNCYFLIFYYFKGSLIRSSGCQVYDLDEAEYGLDSLSGILNVRRLIYLWSLTIIVVSSIKLTDFLTQVFLTTREEFPLSSVLMSDKLTLDDALRCDLPLIKNLGFLDLYLLSETSKERRATIFTLSLPGGHPHVWNTVREDCFQTIEEFISSLSSLLIFRQKKEKKEERFDRYAKEPPSMPNNVPPVVSFFNLQVSKYTQIWTNYKLYLETKLKFWLNLPIVVYLFGDREDLKFRHALEKSQPVLWACHSLSHIAVHSLTEDNYGIIQNDLTKIISVLLKLKDTLESVEKHILIRAVDPCANIRGPANKAEISSYGLNKSVKRCIYRISNEFKDFIPDLQLARDAKYQMSCFAEWKII